MIDHYKRLEVDEDASAEVIEKAYRALCLKHHPDRQPADRRAAATKRMQELNASHSLLCDAQQRRIYDERRRRARLRSRRDAEALGIFLDDGLVGLFRMWIREGAQG